MSEYKVFTAVDKTIRKLLWSAMQYDSEIVTPILSAEEQISFEPITKLIKETDSNQNYLSVFLYRIVENADLKNRPLERLDTRYLKYPPLSLNLFYLVTPLTNSGDNDHRLLGKVMQIFYDNAILKGSALDILLQNTAEELRIILNPMSLEDTNKLWSALMRPYHLSVCYEVKVIYIDSQRETEGTEIRYKQIQYTQLNATASIP